ncbi:Tumor suppressor candidate 4, partial [Operophtera brumata]
QAAGATGPSDKCTVPQPSAQCARRQRCARQAHSDAPAAAILKLCEQMKYPVYIRSPGRPSGFTGLLEPAIGIRRLFTGRHCADEICCLARVDLPSLEQIIEDDPNTHDNVTITAYIGVTLWSRPHDNVTITAYIAVTLWSRHHDNVAITAYIVSNTFIEHPALRVAECDRMNGEQGLAQTNR